MRAAELTQGELAERSAIGRVTLVRIEKGEQSPGSTPFPPLLTRWN